jgi:uncharacterized protein (DUF433 family)
MITETQIATRITRDSKILGGKPIIRGSRIPVYVINDYLLNGESVAQLLEDFTGLTLEDVEAAIAFEALEEERTDVYVWKP